jgi:hypothetical protein
MNVMIISNNKIKIKKNLDEKTKNILEARIKYVKFDDIETNTKKLEEINEKLKNEEAQIILYCNKIFHKKNKNKTNNKDILKLIE